MWRRVIVLWPLLVALLGPAAARGENPADYVVTQFAGQIGFLSAGMGKNFPDYSLEADLLFGYAPASVVGEDVFALALKGRYIVTTLTLDEAVLKPYVGMGVHYYLGERYEVNGNYPDDYYPYSQWHLMPHVGIRLQGQGQEEPSLYVEAGILDTYFIHYLNNNNYLDPSDVISVSVGFFFPLQ